MILKKFYTVLLIATCLLGCKPEPEVIKADLSSAFIGKYSGILAHGDAQYPSLTQESWEVEVFRLNETEVNLDVQIQLQERVDVSSPFINTGDPDIIALKLGKVATEDKSLFIKKEANYIGVIKSKVGISMTGRKRDAGLLALEVKYDYLDIKGVRFFTILLNKK